MALPLNRLQSIGAPGENRFKGRRHEASAISSSTKKPFLQSGNIGMLPMQNLSMRKNLMISIFIIKERFYQKNMNKYFFYEKEGGP